MANIEYDDFDDLMKYNLEGGRLTSNGYVKRSPSELKEMMVERLRRKYSNFFEQPADIQNMLLDTALQGILEYENLCAEMVNAYAPFYQNDFMFKQLASSLGLTIKGAYKAQVMLKFSGPYGTFIPQGTSVGGFVTQESAVIPTAQEVLVVALSEEEGIKEADTLTEGDEPLPVGVTVTNPLPSLAYVPTETPEQLRKRAQEIIRSPRLSSREYARARLAGLEGVDPRLINFREVEYAAIIDTNTVFYKGIECVCGGGDPNEIGRILFTSFLDTQALLSQPSDNDTARTQEVPIIYYGTQTSVKFTTPKLLNVHLNMEIKFKGSLLTATNVESVVNPVLINYFNTRMVGTPLNKTAINDLIVTQLKKEEIPAETIAGINLELEINGNPEQWDADGYLPLVKFDCYTILEKIEVQVIAGA